MSTYRIEELRGSAAETDQCGAVLIEWAIVAFGLVVGFFIFFDTARALDNYMTLANIVSEGSLMAARVSALEAGANMDLNPSAIDMENCQTMSPTAFPCGQNIIQQRVSYLVTTLTSSLKPGYTHITTNFIPPNTLGNEQDNTVIVTIGATYDGIVLRGIPITASKQAGYLFRQG